MKLISNKEYNQFGKIHGSQIYGYLIAIIILTVLGIIFQIYCCVNLYESDNNKFNENDCVDKNDKNNNEKEASQLIKK